MERVMLINVVEEEEARVAVLEDGKLQELYLERAGTERIVANVYKGIVTNIVKNIDAAFVEFGYRKQGFLHVSDVKPSSGNGGQGGGGRKRDISRLLREGQQVLVQVTKEGIGDKGPSLTTYLSLPGRYLVLMPGMSRHGVSRKIIDDPERQRLRECLGGLKTSGDYGLIVRTAGRGRSADDLAGDVRYLESLWKTVSERAKKSKVPSLVYQESDQVIRVIRDIFTEDTKDIIVDSQEVYAKVREFFKSVIPQHVRKVKRYEGSDPLFHQYGVEEELAKIHSRTVKLPAGGSIVLEQTEALVAIDVNSGQFKGKVDAEDTAFKINMEAAPEIARQIRLRDLGGLVVIDFIDMEDLNKRREVEKALWDVLKRDRARMRMLRMSPFCIVELTRQRQRRSLYDTTYVDCPTCKGSGQIKSPETLALEILRRLKVALEREELVRAEVRACPAVANHLNNIMRARLQQLEATSGKGIKVSADAVLGPGEHSMGFFKANGKQMAI